MDTAMWATISLPTWKSKGTNTCSYVSFFKISMKLERVT